MAETSLSLSVCILLLLMVVVADGAPKAKQVKCQDKNYPTCYHQKLHCPDSCLRTCEVDCVSCQPVCTSPNPPPPPPKVKAPKNVTCKHKAYPACYNKHFLCPADCPKSCQVDCASCQPTCAPLLAPLPPPQPKAPKNVTCKHKAYPACYNKQFLCPASCPRDCHADCASCQPVCKALPPTPLSPPQPSGSPPVPVSPPSSSPGKAYCKNKNYPQCYRLEHKCPSACPDHCEVDCVTCSPVCNCNKPGAVCQDPRFIGADGITFYFHGKKGQEFCIVSDSNLHINAHFIGKRNDNMRRDFTWVQSLGILFNDQKLYIGARKTAIWDNAVDRIELILNDEPAYLPQGEGATWQSTTTPLVTITRSADTNAVVIEVEGNFKIKANVVPITQKDSRVHNYGINDDDCFAHLDLGFSFYSLTGEVNGVLGQTYASNYTSRVKMGVDMPVLGGDIEFSSSSIFSTDCAVSRFSGRSDSLVLNTEYSDLNCASPTDGAGVIFFINYIFIYSFTASFFLDLIWAIFSILLFCHPLLLLEVEASPVRNSLSLIGTPPARSEEKLCNTPLGCSLNHA